MRDAVYDKIDGDGFEEILNLYETILKSQDRVQQIANTEEHNKNRLARRANLSTIVALVGSIGTIAGIVASILIWLYG